jgi:hypothetical protein
MINLMLGNPASRNIGNKNQLQALEHYGFCWLVNTYSEAVTKGAVAVHKRALESLELVDD